MVFVFKLRKDNLCTKQLDLLGDEQMDLKRITLTYFNTAAFSPPDTHTKMNTTLSQENIFMVFESIKPIVMVPFVFCRCDF